MSDDYVQRLVEDALDWADPSVDGSRIGVTVDKGVVTLRGTVDTSSQKRTAERVALGVRGVETVINHIAIASPAETEGVQRKHARGRQRERGPSRAAGP